MTEPAQASADGQSSRPRYYGKYRGTVLENLDPLLIGRIIAQVPDVLGELPSSWAMPCVPAAGIQSGAFIVPPIGSQVWIEFEQGDPDYPIWIGGFWGLAADVPALALIPAISPGQNIVIQTTGQNSLILSDAAPTPATGGIILKGASGGMIVVNETGITLSNGQGAVITLIGPTVAINGTALTVTGP